MKAYLTFLAVILEMSIVMVACGGGGATNNGQNIPISVVELDQEYPEIISDGAGCVVIVWNDYRSSYADIYAQKVCKNMKPVWTKNGVSVTSAKLGQVTPRMCAGGEGSVIITWLDERSSENPSAVDHPSDIYAQKIGVDGKPAWTVDGIAVSDINGIHGSHAIASDGSGGAIIAWVDYGDGKQNSLIYIQIIDSQGNAVWAEGGIKISSVLSLKGSIEMVETGRGDVIISWIDRRNEISTDNSDIYTQKIDSNGNIEWGGKDLAVTTADMDPSWHKMVSDGQGGVIITWSSSSHGDIYAQRIDSDGQLKWTADGLPVVNADNSQDNPQIIADGLGNVVIIWGDYRNGQDNDIYAQKIDINGVSQWTENGILVCDDDQSQSNPRLAADGNGGVIVTWESDGNNYDVYAQRVDSNGNLLWSESRAVSVENESQWGPEIASLSDSSGAVIVWTDFRNDETTLGRDVYGDFVKID